MTNRKHHLRFTASLVAATMFAGPALAQESAEPQESGDDSGLGVIIVTARRVSENLQNVPASVTAVTGEVLQQKSVLKVEDLTIAVPGFTAQATIQQGAPLYTIRGQHGDINVSANTEPSVQVYFAELTTARAIGTTAGFFDLSNVQVLKGPQGTLFGRNSTGGAILITPMAPKDSFGASLRGSYGNYDYMDLEGVLNIPLGDKVALRAAAKLTKRDGFIKNLTDNSAAGEINEHSERLTIQFKPTETLTSTFIGTNYETDVDGQIFKIADFDPTFLRSVGLDFGGLYDQYITNDVAAQRSLGFYNLRSVDTPFVNNKVWSIQNNTEFEISDQITLKNIIGYRKTRERQSSEFTGVSGSYYGNSLTSPQKMFSEEFQVQGKFGKIEVVLGAFFYQEKVELLARTKAFQSLNQFSSIPGLEFIPSVFPLRDVVHNFYNTKSKSVFAHFNYNLDSLAQGFSISGGARYTQDKKTVVFSHFNNNGLDPSSGVFVCQYTGAITPTGDEALCNFPARTKSSEPTYDISLNYQANDDLLLYLAHRRGYRSGGFDIIVANTAEPAYKPEFVDDFEFGVKADFDIGNMPVRFNGAAYYQLFKDIQRLVARPTANGTSPNSTINAAKAKILGTEFELTMKPVAGLELSGTYAYTKPKYTEWVDFYTSPVTGLSTRVDISDSGFSYVARHQFSLTARYEYTLANDMGDLGMSATWYGQSSMFVSDNTTANCGPDGAYLYCLNRKTKLPAYSLVNARVDWRNVAGKGFDLGIFATNLTNKKYLSTILGNAGTLGSVSSSPGAPRMYGLVLKLAFGGE